MKVGVLHRSSFLLVALIISCTFCIVPKPEIHETTNQAFAVAKDLEFIHEQPKCFILHDAIRRFVRNIRQSQIQVPGVIKPAAIINSVQLHVAKKCDETTGLMWPHVNMNESYVALINGSAIKILAAEIWGLLYGLETVAQLIYKDQLGTLFTNETLINDQPRFIHRGYLIDTSRHFLPVDNIMQFLDAMTMVKMNVLHWHIVDDQSFPYMSFTYPELSQKGAFDSKTHVYTQNDVQHVLHYARLRGIRVMPEFDTPGHSYSWGKSHPELLTECYSESGPSGTYEAFNPARNSTFEFMTKLLLELFQVFPDQYLHLGGDEISYTCWKTNPEIKQFMTKMGFGQNFAQLEGYYIQMLLRKLQELSKQKPGVTPILWEDVYIDGLRNETSAIMHIWRWENWEKRMNEITAAGYRVLFSSCWYLNLIDYGTDWPRYYDCDPTDFGGTPQQIANVIGGEACMWGEYVDQSNLFSRSWPRGAAVAERLWSTGKHDRNEFSRRLDELCCRMLNKGWDAEPTNGPGYCST